jgi:hypothetical protein
MSPTLTNQLYRDVRAKVRRELFKRVDVPWMKAKELDIILEILARLRPARCLEWGAGLSTLYFPPRTPGLTRWLSIEHHREWYQTVAGRNTDPRVAVVHIPPDGATTSPPAGRDAEDSTRVGTGTTGDDSTSSGRQPGTAVLPAGASRLVEDSGGGGAARRQPAGLLRDVPPFAHRADDWKRRAADSSAQGRPIPEGLNVAAHRDRGPPSGGPGAFPEMSVTP